MLMNLNKFILTSSLMSENHHHDHQWDKKASFFYESMQKQIKSRYLPFAKVIQKVVKEEFDGEDITLLDLACGPGVLIMEILKKVPDIDILGVDPSSEMLNIARRETEKKSYSNIKFKEGSAEEIPVESESVKAVTCLNSLHDFKDPKKAISEISRILDGNGVFILRDRNGNYPKWKIKLNYVMRSIQFGRKNTKRYFRSTPHWLNPLEIMDWMRKDGFQVLKFRNTVEYLIIARKNHSA